MSLYGFSSSLRISSTFSISNQTERLHYRYIISQLLFALLQYLSYINEENKRKLGSQSARDWGSQQTSAWKGPDMIPHGFWLYQWSTSLSPQRHLIKPKSYTMNQTPTSSNNLMKQRREYVAAGWWGDGKQVSLETSGSSSPAICTSAASQAEKPDWIRFDFCLIIRIKIQLI